MTELSREMLVHNSALRNFSSTLTDRPERDDVVHSVVRALSLVEALNRQPVTSLESLHHSTGMPKPTLVRLLDTLIAAGYVHRVSRREGYAVTEAVLRLSAGVRNRDVLVDVARPLMEAFTHEHKWQLSLATYETGAMLIRATTRDISPFSRDELFLNRRVSVLGSVVGKAYFANCSAAEREFIIEIARQEGSPDREIAESPALVREAVETARRRGYAGDRPNRPGAYRSIGVPIFRRGSEEEVLGAVVMFWYRSVMAEWQVVERYLEPLREMARQIADGVATAAPPAAQLVDN